MKWIKKIKMTSLFMFICVLMMNISVYATESEQAKDKKDEVIYNVSLNHWNRRIYDLCFDVQGLDSNAEEIRVYAGANYHLTDAYGDILSEGDSIDADGYVTTDSKSGIVSRDRNGWYVVWKNPKFDKMKKQHVYIQANVEFIGGNNQSLSVQGLSGLYASSEDSKPAVSFDFEDIPVNVKTEVDLSDTVVPVMKGINVENAAFLSKAIVKMDAVYGELRDLPIAVQWYRVEGEKESPIGEPMTQLPYHIPESEFEVISNEDAEYRVEVLYRGEASTSEAKSNTSGKENIVSDTDPMDQASYRTELITGCIDLTVQLNRTPYNHAQVSQDFRYRLYRFDQQNQHITSNTPYTVYTVTFEKGSTQLEQHLMIDGLSDGWYTLVPEIPTGDFAEITDERRDNYGKDGRTGTAAGVDFHMGQIVDNKYSWEKIRYQGQDTKDSVGDNFFNVTYKYKETLYSITYDENAPKGSEVFGDVPKDTAKYREGTMVDIQLEKGTGLSADGWQFAGWSLEPGDGQYYNTDVIYSNFSVAGIPVKKQVEMQKGGITLYAKWIPVYEVNYHGNTYSGGEVPKDTNGTIASGSNLYYNGDFIIVQAPGNLNKQDSDGIKYEFAGWSLSQDGSGMRYYEGDRIFIESSDITLYAQWKAIGTDKFAANYIPVIPKGTSLLGQAPADKDKYAVGSVVKVMGRGTMSVMKYRFAGWALTSKEDGLYVEGEEIFGSNDLGETVTREETVMKEQGLSFYARWIPLYQVIYHADVKEGIPEDLNEYETDDEVLILSGDHMQREGYTFIGWNTEEDGSGKRYTAGDMVTNLEEDLELYAQWEKIPESGKNVTDHEPTESSKGIGTIPLILMAVIGTACITACVVYNLMKRVKD